MILTATIEGRCVPWMRASSRGRQRYTPADQRAYQRHVRAVVARAAPRQWPLDMRYALELVVYEPDARRRDLSNELKTIEDALNATAWADDSQIDAIGVVRRIDRVRPRIEMTVAPMTLAERDETTVTIRIGADRGNDRCTGTPGIVASEVDASVQATDAKRPRSVGAPGVVPKAVGGPRHG